MLGPKADMPPRDGQCEHGIVVADELDFGLSEFSEEGELVDGAIFGDTSTEVVEVEEGAGIFAPLVFLGLEVGLRVCGTELGVVPERAELGVDVVRGQRSDVSSETHGEKDPAGAGGKKGRETETVKPSSCFIQNGQRRSANDCG